MAIHLSTVTQPSGRQFIGYLTRNEDSFIYNFSTSTFEGAVLSDLQGNARLPYQLLYTEGSPGSYTASVDVTQFVDGEYLLKVREVANSVEYSNILEDTFIVTAGEVSSNDLVIKITTAPTRTLFAYIQSVATSNYVKSTDLSLEGLDLVSSSISKRLNFRHSYSEPRPSEYILSIDLTSFPNGPYLVKTYELVGDVEISAGEDYLFRVQDGKRLSGIDFGNVSLTENTGGKDSLKYVESNGSPVHEATITVYLSSEYNQGNLANPIGKTMTDPNGRWDAPISVSPGTTYTVVFQKSGYFGPDSTEVVV